MRNPTYRLGGRTFILEGERAEIAKDHFSKMEKPVITWINCKGDIEPKGYHSPYKLCSDFPDAVLVRLPVSDRHVELILAIPRIEYGD